MNIPGYEITRIIAKGGVSTVFVAVQRSLGREVALKILKKGDDAAHATRFMEEGRLLASLHHRNVITVYDVGVTQYWYYIAMEYLQGGSLEDRIREGMPLNAALDLMEILLDCLDSLHKRGIVHRDVKPANVLFEEDGTPKLTDFGIAKHMSSDQDITMDGTALGSPYYLSPEQASAKPLDGRSDIYSLGIVFYEMLTGEKPYRGESHLETLMAHATEPLPKLPEEHASFQEMFERMIAKSPEDRFASASELLGYLRAVRRFGGTAKFPAPDAIESRNRGDTVPQPSSLLRSWLGSRTAAASALVLAALTATATMWLPDSPQESEPEAAVAVRALQGTDGDADTSEAAPPARGLTARHAGEIVSSAEDQPIATFSSAGPATAGSAPAIPIEAPVTDKTLRETTVTEVPQTGPAAGIDPGTGDSPGPLSDTHSGIAAEAIPISDPPAPAFPGPEEQAAADDQIAHWLGQGREAMADYRLTTPPGNNAYEYFRQALAADPGNAEATRGVKQVADTYLRLGRAKQAERDYATADVYANRGLRISPTHEGLLALSAELDRGTTTARRESSGDPVSRLFNNLRGFFAEVPHNTTPQTVVEH